MKLSGPIFVDRFLNCFEASEPIGGYSLPFTTKSPGVSCTHLNNLARMKG